AAKIFDRERTTRWVIPSAGPATGCGNNTLTSSVSVPEAATPRCARPTCWPSAFRAMNVTVTDAAEGLKTFKPIRPSVSGAKGTIKLVAPVTGAMFSNLPSASTIRPATDSAIELLITTEPENALTPKDAAENLT